jgi:integrase
MAKTWSYSTGDWGQNRVRVYENAKRDGVIYMKYRDGDTLRELSLGHKDREEAKEQAKDLAELLRTAAERGNDGPVTLASLFDIYLVEVTPRKGANKQKHEQATVEMFKRFFGEDRVASTLNVRDWDMFIYQRKEGLIGPAGQQSKFFAKTRVRKSTGRQIVYDLTFLNGVLNWATVAGTGAGGSFLQRNPLKGMKYPKVKAPTRYVLPLEEYEKLLEVADKFDWRLRLALILAHETGHRIGSIRQLHWSDFDFEEGTIHWRGEYNKQGYDYYTVLTKKAAHALRTVQVKRGVIGDGWVFPSLKKEDEVCRRDYLDSLLRKAVKAANLPKVRGRGWHSFRRALATDMLNNGLGLRHLMEMGGWKDPMTIVKCYQKSNLEHQREVLEDRSVGLKQQKR